MAAGKGVALWLGLRATVSTVPAVYWSQTRSIGLGVAKGTRTSGDTVPWLVFWLGQYVAPRNPISIMILQSLVSSPPICFPHTPGCWLCGF